MTGKKKVKRYLAVLMILAMLIVLLPVGVAAQEIKKNEAETVVFTIGQKSYLKGNEVIKTDIAPYIKEIGGGLGRTMVPVAFVAPALGSEPAQWFPNDRSVLITKGEKKVRIFIDSKDLLVNGEKMQMDAAAEIVDVGSGGGRTMLPIAFIARALEVGYEWFGETKEVNFYGKNVVFDKTINYGPDVGAETIEGNVTVKAPNVILNNLYIKGNLTIAEEVGDEDVMLNNITVNGETYIRGGGKDSIHINGGQYSNITVQNVGGHVRIVATDVDGLAVVIAEEAAGEEIILEGTFDSVTVDAENTVVSTQGATTVKNFVVGEQGKESKIILSANTTVASMTLESKAEITGTGQVDKAEVKADGVIFETAPKEQTVAEGVTGPTTPPPLSTGGGGDSPPVDPATSATYTLTVQTNQASGGSAADNTNTGPYAEGAAVSVTAAANEGYVFMSWTIGGAIVSADAAYNYTMPAANTTLTANFLPVGYIPIANADELDKIRNATASTFGTGTPFEGTYIGGLDKKYLQVADIELGVAAYTDDTGWIPIGAVWDTPFSGIFDGNGYGIDNLFINRPTTDGVGLFGYVGEEGLLKGIALTDVDVTGEDEVGALAGANEGTIDSCSSTGEVSGNIDTGGLVGISFNDDKPIDRHALIKDSHSGATVLNGSDIGGGLVGSNRGLIENCFATGAVTSVSYPGGLAGQNFGKITGSYATGNVAGDIAGGLAGENYKTNDAVSKYNATITDSFAEGDVVGRWSIGGLVGYSLSGTIDNCYATGDVSGEEAVAGLVGEFSSGTLSNSFALNGQITRTSGSALYFGRIRGQNSSGTLDNNYARDDMVFAGIDRTPVSNADGADGASISDWTIEDGEVVDYTLTPVLSDVATVSSETYVVSGSAGGAANIQGVPYQTAKAAFLAALTKGQDDQTWNIDNIADPVVSGNTLEVTAQDGTSKVTYTIFVNTTLADPSPIAVGASNPSTTISLLNSTFTAGAENTGNWTINTGTTGLTAAAITLQGAAEEATGVTIDFTGTATSGTMSFQALAVAVTSGRDTTTKQLRVPSNDTAVSAEADAYSVTVDATSLIPADNPITSDEVLITTAGLVGEFTDRLYFPEESDFKVLANATVTGAGAFENWDFDSIEAKSNMAKMALNDVLLVEAEDGTLRGYHISVIPQVFFSEYVEGISNNKALEIYNFTDSTVELQAYGYKIESYLNGSSEVSNTVNLNGTINAGDVYVVAHSSSTVNAEVVDQYYDFSFNGNDAVVLKMGDLILDRIGQVGFTPGTGWTVGEVSTLDHTLRRKSSITIGDRNSAGAFDPSMEWDSYDQNTLNGLGAHIINTEPK